MTQPPPSLPAPRDDELHPEAVDAAVRYSEAIKTAARLKDELAKARAYWQDLERQLRSELSLERRMAEELRRLLDQQVRRADYYVAYANEIRTHLATLAGAAMAANDVARKIAEDADSAPKIPEQKTPAVPDEAAALKVVEDAIIGGGIIGG